MKNRDLHLRRYKKHCAQDNDASVPFKVGILGPHTVLPIVTSCPIVFFWILSTVWNLFPFKDDFSFEKSQKSQGTKSGLQGASATWVIGCFTKKLCLRCDAWVGALLWWSCQSPIAHIYGLSNHPNSFHRSGNSFHRGRFKLLTKFDADLLLYSLSDFECDSYTVHMLIQQHQPYPSSSLTNYSEVVIHACAFQSNLLGCQVTSMSHKLLSLY